MPVGNNANEGSFKPKRPIRRSQLISPWGVGAIVPFPNDESLMIAGLDMWEYRNKENFLVNDARFAKRLGVSELRRPPDYRDPKVDVDNKLMRIPAVRFPRWHYCPYCGTMSKVSYYTSGDLFCGQYAWTNGRTCRDGSKRRRLIPERFIVICPEGHIDDFPVAEWLHELNGRLYDPSSCKIRRSTGGISSSLAGVRYECSCGAKRSMAGATRPGALSRIYSCKGSKPWLGIDQDEENPCNNTNIRVVQRGGTNVWFADIRSSIYIPVDNSEADETVIKIAENNMHLFENSVVDGEVDINQSIVNAIAKKYQIDSEKLYTAIYNMLIGKQVVEKQAIDISEEEYRFAEYRVLISSGGQDNLEFYSINHPVNEYDRVFHRYFKSISLVPVLKETRALIGFSRLEPALTSSIEDMKKMLRLGEGNWLPAIDVYGEGIFIEFSRECLENWVSNRSVQHRTSILESHYKSMYTKRHLNGSLLNPKYVLLHTFAHLLINQLAFECGYGSSSIRERIYCDKGDEIHDMFGILIYTASGDSEGTLGGLVRQGKPGRLENIFLAAIENAKWCSADPVCIESMGQGPDSCNLAACHNCALLPETCCETGNRLLDRGLVIGEEAGYFMLR